MGSPGSSVQHYINDQTMSAHDLDAYLKSKGAIRKMFVGATWVSAKEIGDKYNIMYTVRNVFLQNATRNFLASTVSNFIFDHSESITDEEKETIISMYPQHKITFFEHVD